MSVEVTPDVISGASFSSTLRGYDKDEVRAFLDDIAQRVTELQEEAENAHLSLGDRIGRLLQDAKDNADEIVERAQAEASQEREVAAADTKKVREEADAYSLDTRTQADEYARKTREDADAYSERTQQEATDEGTRVRAEADTDARSTRQAAEEDKARRIQEADERVAQLEDREKQVRLRLTALGEQLEAMTAEIKVLGTPAETTEPTELTIEESVGG